MKNKEIAQQIIELVNEAIENNPKCLTDKESDVYYQLQNEIEEILFNNGLIGEYYTES